MKSYLVSTVSYVCQPPHWLYVVKVCRQGSAGESCCAAERASQACAHHGDALLDGGNHTCAPRSTSLGNDHTHEVVQVAKRTIRAAASVMLLHAGALAVPVCAAAAELAAGACVQRRLVFGFHEASSSFNVPVRVLRTRALPHHKPPFYQLTCEHGQKNKLQGGWSGWWD